MLRESEKYWQVIRGHQVRKRRKQLRAIANNVDKENEEKEESNQYEYFKTLLINILLRY